MDRPVSLVALCADRTVAALLRAAFPKPNFYLAIRETAADAQLLLKSVHFDAALLHWDAQDQECREVMTQIKGRGGRTPACILADDAGTAELEAAFGDGVREVVAVSSRPEQLRFCLQLSLQRAGVAPPGSCQFGRLSINPLSFSVRWRDLEIRVGRVEFRLLELMLKHHRETLSREYILSRLWPSGGYKSPRLVDVHVSSLRRAFIRDAQIKPVQTVPGVGYRLRIIGSRAPI